MGLAAVGPSATGAQASEPITAQVAWGQKGDTRPGETARGRATAKILFISGTARRDKGILRLNRSGQRIVFDTNHPVRAGIGCRKRNRKTLSCTGSGVIGIGAVLGPKKDRFEAGERINRFLAVDAGGGNDRVRGGAVTSALVGGKGNDRLKGRGAPDALVGGKGRDLLVGAGGNDTLIGGKNRDRLRGGPGTDTKRQ